MGLRWGGGGAGSTSGAGFSAVLGTVMMRRGAVPEWRMAVVASSCRGPAGGFSAVGGHRSGISLRLVGRWGIERAIWV